MKRIFLLFCFLTAWAAPALGQEATVVQTCGTLPLAYAPGSTRNLTVDVNGKLCGSNLATAVANMTFNVATTGSDSNPCTSGSPCLTIQKAVNVAAGYNWDNQYYPTINVACATSSTYANTQVVLPALVNAPNNNQSVTASIVGNTTTPTNCILQDSGTGYNFSFATGSRWSVKGFSIAGTYGGIFAHSFANVWINNLDFAGALAQIGISGEPNSAIYDNNDGTQSGTYTISASTMNIWLFSRGIVVLDNASITINHAITMNNLIALDAQAFLAFDGTTITNGSNVTASNGLMMNNGARLEANSTTKVDGTALSRSNFPGGNVVVDGWSIFQPDQATVYGTAGTVALTDTNGALRADYNSTTIADWTFQGSANMTSANTAGTGFGVINTSAGGHDVSFGTVGSGGEIGLAVGSSFFIDITTGNVPWWVDTSANFNIWGVLGWGPSSGGSFSVPTKDAGISRLGAASLAIGNGTAGDFTGTLKLASLVTKGSISYGTSPVGTTGSCSASSFSGGSTAGKFTAPTCAGGTIILSSLPAAPNGYTCNAQDQTTSTDTLKQTANTVSSATFTATTAVNDVVVFQCTGW